MSSSKPLKIAVLGVGGIGSTFAFQLARVGQHDVTVIARAGSTRLRQLQCENGIVDVNDLRADVRVSETLDEGAAYDLVIVTVLDYQVNVVLPTLKRSAAQCILFMFNTFEPERLGAAVGAERCALGMPFVQARLDQDGKLNATIGSMGQKTIMSQQRWVDVFNASGLPASLEPEMALWLRCHVPMCVAFESVSVAGMRRGGGASWNEAMTLARGAHECFALIQALGYTLYPQSKVRLKKSPVWVLGSILWFMSMIKSFRILLATGINECRALVDVIILAASHADPKIEVAVIQSMSPPE